MLITEEKPKTRPYEEGDPSYPVCLIGEAPSFMEMREGRPFVGPAGQLLDRCLHAAQIPRARCYITNVFEEEVTKPKDGENKINSKSGTTLWTSKGGFTPEGLLAARNTIDRIKACKANVIVAVGAPALHLCLLSKDPFGTDAIDNNPQSITKWRGSIIESGDLYGSRKVIPTIHPAASLRGKYEWRYLITSDFQKAKRESAFPQITPPTRRLLIDPTFEDACRYLKRCREARSFNTDIEVFRGQVDCFSLAYDPNEAMCITLLKDAFTHRFSTEEERVIWTLYAEALGDPECEKINQNIVFDLYALLHLNKIVPRGPVQDPMVGHSVIYPFLEKNLGTITSMWTDEPYYKDDGILEDSPTVADFRRRWEYNAKDSFTSFNSWLKIKPEIAENGFQSVYDNTMGLVSSLAYMMTIGIKLNAEELKRANVSARERLAEIVDRATKAFGRKVLTEAPKASADWKKIFKSVFPNEEITKKTTIKKMKEALAGRTILISSPDQLCDYFYGEKEIKPYTNEAGNPTIDDLSLSRIVRRFDLPEAKVVQEYRKLAKLIETYLEMGYDSDSRLRTSFNIRGTWTGRLSSSATIFKTGGNFQNLVEEFMSFLETSARPHPHFEDVEKVHA